MFIFTSGIRRDRKSNAPQLNVDSLPGDERNRRRKRYRPQNRERDVCLADLFPFILLSFFILLPRAYVILRSSYRQRSYSRSSVYKSATNVSTIKTLFLALINFLLSRKRKNRPTVAAKVRRMLAAVSYTGIALRLPTLLLM